MLSATTKFLCHKLSAGADNTPPGPRAFATESKKQLSARTSAIGPAYHHIIFFSHFTSNFK